MTGDFKVTGAGGAAIRNSGGQIRRQRLIATDCNDQAIVTEGPDAVTDFDELYARGSLLK